MTGWRVGLQWEILRLSELCPRWSAKQLPTNNRFPICLQSSPLTETNLLLRSAFEGAFEYHFILCWMKYLVWNLIKPRRAFSFFPNVRRPWRWRKKERMDFEFTAILEEARGCFSNGSLLWCPSIHLSYAADLNTLAKAVLTALPWKNKNARSLVIFEDLSLKIWFSQVEPGTESLLQS